MLNCKHQRITPVVDTATGHRYVTCALVTQIVGESHGFVEPNCDACPMRPGVPEEALNGYVRRLAVIALDAKLSTARMPVEAVVPKMLDCGATPDDCRSSIAFAVAIRAAKIEDAIYAERFFE